MKQTYNFSAGPSILPRSVLEIAQHELLNFKNSGISVLEMSHRTPLYENIHNQAQTYLRKLLNLKEDQAILFIQGGASLQFSMIPMNLAHSKKAYYVDGGTWGRRAYEEAQLILGDNAVLLASSKASNYTKLPEIPEVPSDGAYLHITTNNTIEGTAIKSLPKCDIPLVADMSSNIFSVDYDYNQFDVIYAGAQKNLGPAGVTVVIIKKPLLKTIQHALPSMLDYRIYEKNNSMFNTPPTFSIYLLKEVLEWIDNLGGVKEMAAQAQYKSQLLYDTLDQSTLFKTPVCKADRSVNNIPFYTDSDSLNALFLKEAEAQGLINLKGHRLVGGMRASIYNAMPVKGVEALCHFIKQFEKEYQNV